MFTSDRMDWATPQSFFDLVNAEFEFTLDAAAELHNAKCQNFLTEAEDALMCSWEGVVWCNPPYGRSIADWVRKGYSEAQPERLGGSGSTVVMLIPARTDTAYWHDYVMKAAEVRLVRGRLVFGSGEARANAPFPSALVVFRPGEHSTVLTTMGRGTLTRRAAA
jgi:site-specific DNA-methyltransferase (adenine-specific)